MRQVLGIAGAALALLFCAACTQRAPVSAPSSPPLTQSAVASRAVEPGVDLSIEIASVQLGAGTSQVATITLANSTTSTVEVYPVVGVRIFASDGRTVFDSHPKRIRHPNTKTPLTAGEVRHTAVRFVVPAVGTYRMVGYLMAGDQDVAIEFRSVARP